MSKATVSLEKKAGDQEIAERMRSILESQRVLGGDAYPPTLRRLAELCDLQPSNPLVKKAANKNYFKKQAIVAWQDKREPDLDAPVILSTENDLADQVAAVAPSLLIRILKFRMPEGTRALTVAELKDKLTEKLKKPFQEAIRSKIERRSLPSEIAWIVIRGKERLFHIDDLQPTPLSRGFQRDGEASAPTTRDSPSIAHEAPKRDFAEAFREVFERLDRDNGGTNFVTLSDLRRALSEFDRAAFDAGLRQLRIDGQFSLDSHEGLTGPLTPEEREAGVQEAGSLLVYVSRR